MENSTLEMKSLDINDKNRNKIQIHFGWWILGFFLIIILIGFIISLINSEVTYFEPFLWFIDLILSPFGYELETLDYRATPIIEELAQGAVLTVVVSFLSVICGFFFAILLAVILVSKGNYILKILKVISQIYIDFFRSTPLLVQILLVYFGMPRGFLSFIRDLNIRYFTAEVFAGIVALSLNTAAYQAEIIRSGILAIPSGQTEAARALGLSTTQTMRYVILPQAIRIIVPPLTNELINVLLNSSLISAIGVTELTKNGQVLQARYFMWEVFLFTALFYFVIAFTLSKITKKVEEKLRIPGLGVSND